jgi:hypothetical protein
MAIDFVPTLTIWLQVWTRALRKKGVERSILFCQKVSGSCRVRLAEARRWPALSFLLDRLDIAD